MTTLLAHDVGIDGAYVSRSRWVLHDDRAMTQRLVSTFHAAFVSPRVYEPCVTSTREPDHLSSRVTDIMYGYDYLSAPRLAMKLQRYEHT